MVCRASWPKHWGSQVCVRLDQYRGPPEHTSRSGWWSWSGKTWASNVHSNSCTWGRSKNRVRSFGTENQAGPLLTSSLKPIVDNSSWYRWFESLLTVGETWMPGWCSLLPGLDIRRKGRYKSPANIRWVWEWMEGKSCLDRVRLVMSRDCSGDHIWMCCPTFKGIKNTG